ncbi:MAG TPA: hypothetical protein VH934_22415 [Xanthobacteraceae bacterium]|jgi:hypothetical protein
MMQRTLVWAAGPAAWLMLAAFAAGAAPPSRYDGYQQGAYLSYLNVPAPGGDITRPPRLRISFGVRSYAVVMDTGSTGVVVSADKIPNIDRLPSLGPGQLTYSSSGRIMIGRWVVTPVTIAGRNGASVTTAPIAVLAVTRVECSENARRCTPRAAPRGISMLGIGFARRADHQEQSGPSKNPFLNVAAVNGSKAEHLRSGYIVRSGGVAVGLTAANTQGDFAYVKLARAGDDWAATPACISVNGAKPAACGTLLMDTGVSVMYLTVPGSQAPDAIRASSGRAPALPAGTNLTISIPAESSPQAFYSFTVGTSGNPLAPARVNLVSLVRPPFVNTSVHFLNGFDYLYDADGGFVGLRWTGHAAPNVGKVVASAPPPD